MLLRGEIMFLNILMPMDQIVQLSDLIQTHHSVSGLFLVCSIACTFFVYNTEIDGGVGRIT